MEQTIIMRKDPSDYSTVFTNAEKKILLIFSPLLLLLPCERENLSKGTTKDYIEQIALASKNLLPFGIKRNIQDRIIR